MVVKAFAILPDFNRHGNYKFAARRSDQTGGNLKLAALPQIARIPP